MSLKFVTKKLEGQSLQEEELNSSREAEGKVSILPYPPPHSTMCISTPIPSLSTIFPIVVPYDNQFKVISSLKIYSDIDKLNDIYNPDVWAIF